MYPIITFSNFSFSSYHLFNIIAIGAFILSLKFLIKKSEIDKGFDFVFYVCFIFVIAFIGSKLFYLFEDFEMSNLLEKIVNFKNGFVLYGAMIFVFLGSYFYAKSIRSDCLLLLDFITISFCLSIVIGKIGCLSAGCCYGVRTSFNSIGLIYTNLYSIASPKNVPLFPIQIVDGLFAFILFLILLFVRNRQYFRNGSIFLMFCVAYPIYRFFSEIYRADNSRGFVFNGMFSLSQLYSLIVLMFVLFYLLYVRIGK